MLWGVVPSKSHYTVYTIFVPESQHAYQLCEMCLSWHSYLVTTVKMCTPVLSFILSLSPSMLSQSVNDTLTVSIPSYNCTLACSCISLSLSTLTLSASYASNSILLFYLVLESQHADPVCEVWLHWHPYLVTVHTWRNLSSSFPVSSDGII